MKLIRGLVILCAFIGSSSLAGISIKTPEIVESRIFKAAIHILGSCYENRVTPLGLAEDSTGMFVQRLLSETNLPAALIDVTAEIGNNIPVPIESRYKLQLFVVAASSSIDLTQNLRQIKATIWWNHLASFLILNSPTSKPDCTNAFEMLWTAWEMNILNANLMCDHRTKGPLIYTFNPYTSDAPKIWQREKTYSGRNNHPFTLFVRKYKEGKGVCNELDFEKANDLSGYEIRVSIASESCGSKYNLTSKLSFNIAESVVCETVFPALNATRKVLVHKGDASNRMGFIDNKGNVNGILGEVAAGLSDIGPLPRVLSSMGNLTATHSHMQIDFRSLTQYAGYKSQLSKICSVIDIRSRCGLGVVVLITILFFKFFLGESAVVAHLSTFRIICNSSLLKIPTRIAVRIYLGSLFFFAVTMQGIYQGKLASLLTKDIPLRNVNTIKDLAELGHTIYGSESYHLLFNDSTFKERFIGIENMDCIKYALQDSKAACFGPLLMLAYEAVNLTLHLSNSKLFSEHSALPIRPDWPLEKRINTILKRLVESDLIEHLYASRYWTFKQHLDRRETQHIDENPKVLTLKQLSFTFVILGIGITCAAVCFIIEVGLG